MARKRQTKGPRAERPDGLCGAATKSGGTCKQAAGYGTDHPGLGNCKLHGGSTPLHNKSAQIAIAHRAVAEFGLPRSIEPLDALEEELHRTAGAISWLEDAVRGLEDGELVGPVGTSGLSEGIEHHPQGAPHIYYKMLTAERDHFAKVAKTMLDAGVDERRIKLAEEQGKIIARVLNAVLVKLKIPATERERVPGLVRSELTALEGGKA